ncbi:MAG TPA: FIST N-terminal domain-containing protein [Isosphaeraceae bacterium]|jgi:small ligand-binding sensory domain FIST|nr:FIST N-terminal domain-containing protein [Isosphaeraceae bacterium]
MACASALSTAKNSDRAFQEVLDRVQEGLGGKRADLVAIFASSHHADRLDRLTREIRDRELGRHVLGCTGESIIGDGQEVEAAPAVSLWAIHLPGIGLNPIRLTFDATGFSGWPSELAGVPLEGRTILLLADPFSFPTDEWLKAINAISKPPRVVGGVASGAQAPGRNRLVLDDEVFSDGAVGIVIDQAASIRTVVSQGCRPIGRPWLVTRVENNIIRELGRRPALDVLREQFAELDAADQELVQQGLHIGRVINEYQDTFQRGDFLVRNVMGADDAGGLAITDVVRVGQTVQFHVRDAASADQDLRALLESERPEAPVTGALLFTCNGRGTRLFSAPNHDVSVLHQQLGPIPVAGFFAMGEIGPVGGQNFLHGFTASVALFRGS